MYFGCARQTGWYRMQKKSFNVMLDKCKSEYENAREALGDLIRDGVNEREVERVRSEAIRKSREVDLLERIVEDIETLVEYESDEIEY